MAKNLKGGYQIISLAMVNLLASGGNTIKGIYNKIEGSYKKPILLEGINIGGAEKHAIYVIPEVSGDDYILKGVYGYDITIDDDDKVTVEAIGINGWEHLPSTYTVEENAKWEEPVEISDAGLYIIKFYFDTKPDDADNYIYIFKDNDNDKSSSNNLEGIFNDNVFVALSTLQVTASDNVDLSKIYRQRVK